MSDLNDDLLVAKLLYEDAKILLRRNLIGYNFSKNNYAGKLFNPISAETTVALINKLGLRILSYIIRHPSTNICYVRKHPKEVEKDVYQCSLKIAKEAL